MPVGNVRTIEAAGIVSKDAFTPNQRVEIVIFSNCSHKGV